MDYDVEMLKIYFNEKNYSKEKIDELLNTNPFDINYVNWLKEREFTGKNLARELIRNYIIHSNDKIQELAAHEDDIISKHLYNSSIISSTKKQIKFMPGYTIFIIGKITNQKNILNLCDKYNIPFISGECTKDLDYFRKIREYYIELSKQIKNVELIENSFNSTNTCIIRSR